MALRLLKYLRQKACYWAKKRSSPQGQNTYENPVELPCRWDDSETQIVEPSGRVVTYESMIMLNVAVKKGGLIFLGTLADVKALGIQMPTVPSVAQGAKEIQRVAKTTGFKGELALVQVWV
jgi:hypothetical protein